MEGLGRQVLRFLIGHRYSLLGYLCLLAALVLTAWLAFSTNAKPLDGSKSVLLALITAIFQAGAAATFTRQDKINREQEQADAKAEQQRLTAEWATERDNLRATISAAPAEQTVAIAIRRLVSLGNNIADARVIAEKAQEEPNAREKQRAVGRLSAALSFLEEQMAESLEDWATMYPRVVDQMKERSGE